MGVKIVDYVLDLRRSVSVRKYAVRVLGLCPYSELLLHGDVCMVRPPL